MVQLNPASGLQTPLLKAILWTAVKLSQESETGLVTALQYGNNQQTEMETDANQ